MSLTSTLTGGLFADSPDYGKMALRSEKKRQGIINLGTQQINALYDGGSAPFYSIAPKTHWDRREWLSAAPEDRNYYSQNKKGNFAPYDPGHRSKNYASAGTGAAVGATLGSTIGVAGTLVGGLVGGLAGGIYDAFQKTPSKRELVNKYLRRGLLFKAPKVESFTGYKEPFFKDREQAYLDYALPQAADQQRQAERALTYSLANRGTQSSTMGRQVMSDLTRTSGEARQRIADEAINQSNSLRQSVESARQESLRQLYQSADPSQALQSAIRTASSFEQPSAFAPVANSFSNLLQQYYTNRDNRALSTIPGMYQQQNPTYLAPLPK